MESHKVFCSACDKEVSILIADGPPGDHQASVHDDELICLEIGEKCTGALCPLGATAPDAMVLRFVQEGLSTDALRTAKAACPSCGFEADFVLYGEGRAACTVCGSAARWVARHAEPI